MRWLICLAIMVTWTSTTGQQLQKRYLLWYSPSRATHITGINVNLFPKLKEGAVYPSIYGVEINLNPLGFFSPFMMAIRSLDKKNHQPPASKPDSIQPVSFKKIYGLQIGSLNMEPTIINGVDLNATGSYDAFVNGITVGAIMNKNYRVRGLSFATIANHDTECYGVQIALINSCNKLKGMQFGLWNKNQKRSLPILNWCFRE